MKIGASVRLPKKKGLFNFYILEMVFPRGFQNFRSTNLEYLAAYTSIHVIGPPAPVAHRCLIVSTLRGFWSAIKARN